MENVCSWRRYADDLDEDGVERPRLPRAVMDRRSRPGPEPTSLEAVGNQWRYALVVVQAGEEEEEVCALLSVILANTIFKPKCVHVPRV